MTIRLTRRVALGATLALTALPVWAQDGWPSGPLHVYVGFPAGSSPDTLARIVTERLEGRQEIKGLIHRIKT